MQLVIQHTWDGQPLPPEREVRLSLAASGTSLSLEVDAPYYGDPPPPTPPGPTWGLWQFEVVELFIAGGDGPYLEVELGPHGHHLVLTLSEVRQIKERELPLDYQAHIEGGRWRGRARLPEACLPPGPHRIGAFAIHGAGENRRYLAAPPLPGEKPDFHQPRRFTPVALPTCAASTQGKLQEG